MQLTPAQLSTLKADIAANVNVIPVGRPFAGTAINLLPNTADANFEIARWYNLTASPDFTVWRDISMEIVLGLITYANMTPLDIPDGTQTWANRSLACQGKQFNLQNLTIGRSTAPMKRTNYRAAMQDCLTNLPAGAGGSLISAGWTNVRDAAKFLATYAEKLFSTGTGSTGSPADLATNGEGTITGTDVENARNS